MLENLKKIDPDIYNAVIGEINRQRNTLELIASENFTSVAVLETMGSPLTNKYAEGYPGKRYYGGCTFVDIAEELARERAKQLFKAEHANVQAHSGSQANLSAYLAFVKPGETIMGMNLSHGGHLTHGHPINFSGFLFNVIHYGVNRETETLDYEELEKLAKENRPKLIMVGASAYPRFFDFKRIREICDEVGAIMVMDMAHVAGLIAADLHPTPVPYADVVTSTTHKTLRGPRSGFVLCKQKHMEVIDKMSFPGVQGGPLMHVIAAKAVAFKEAMTEEFRNYQKRIIENAKVLAQELINSGLKLVSGGTDNHLMLINLTNKGLSGKKVEKALEKAGITVNKNTIPFDEKPPLVTSGIRLGTPAVTTRGMGPDEMKMIAKWIARVIDAIDDEQVQLQIKKEVEELCNAFPLYPEFPLA